MSRQIEKDVLKILQVTLNTIGEEAEINSRLIKDHFKRIVSIFPRWKEADQEWIIDELLRRYAQVIGQDTTLKSEDIPEPWLNTERKNDWQYWPRYSNWLESDLSIEAIDALDKSSDEVLKLLEDPSRTGNWDRRGLIVGHVQSGKTSHYTGLICKAADAGYKIIIVLAGLHNNLRSQTQVRLEEGFLGFDATTIRLNHVTLIGVGNIDSAHNVRPNCATTRANNGDFKKNNNLAITPEQRPWLFVVKKNKAVLTSLLNWIQNYAADQNLNAQNTDVLDNDLPRVNKRVTNLPLLIIDDESDNASVDTGENVVDHDDLPDQLHNPTTINKLIRRIIHSFSRSAYVGYTATPFANIFIHDKGETDQEGPDLFPSAFIRNLSAPSSYIGPAKIFGKRTTEGRTGGLNLTRLIPQSDYQTSDDITSGWMPQGHKNGLAPKYNNEDVLPPSLVEAIDAFLITCAVRHLRGQGTDHSSMLIHVTRFTIVQGAVYQQVTNQLDCIRQRINFNVDADLIIARLKILWEKDFIPTTHEVQLTKIDKSHDLPTWDELLQAIKIVIRDIQVKIINGSAKDSLDYAKEGVGVKVIAIGGDKLSRGLTLEGLSISYFLRASKMYDTLMQMGRWFGYRSGYLDLCRLYTTTELIEWFGHIADASEELREEFESMAANGATPREYGLKVLSHPDLLVTSRLKMRTAKTLMISFSGVLLETTVFHKTPEKLNENMQALKSLLNELGTPDEINPIRKRGGGNENRQGYLWLKKSPDFIFNFLSSFNTHPSGYKVNSDLIAKFVHLLKSRNELTAWNVALMGVKEGSEYEITPSIKLNMSYRTGNKMQLDRYAIGRLLSSNDESIDLNDSEWNEALALTIQARKIDPARSDVINDPRTPNGPAIRRVRGGGINGENNPIDKRGLLILYVLNPDKAEVDFSSNTTPIVGFGISFPSSNSDTKVEYVVANLYLQWEQEYGASE